MTNINDFMNHRIDKVKSFSLYLPCPVKFIFLHQFCQCFPGSLANYVHKYMHQKQLTLIRNYEKKAA